MKIKYPKVRVPLSGQDGNAMAIIARVRKALERASTPQEEISKFTEEAMSGDYDNVLQTCMKWVNVS